MASDAGSLAAVPSVADGWKSRCESDSSLLAVDLGLKLLKSSSEPGVLLLQPEVLLAQRGGVDDELQLLLLVALDVVDVPNSLLVHLNLKLFAVLQLEPVPQGSLAGDLRCTLHCVQQPLCVESFQIRLHYKNKIDYTMNIRRW